MADPEVPPHTPALSEAPANDTASLSDLVRSQAAQIASLIAALEAQGKMLARAFEQPRAEVAASAAVAPTGPTFASIWARYIEALGPKDWLPQIISLMRWPLAHFAPSVCFVREEGRRGKSPMHGPDMLAKDIKAQHWIDFANRIKNEEAQLGVGSRRLMQARFSAALNWAVRHEIIDRNPLATIRRETARPKRETRVTTDYLERLRPHATPVGWAYAVTLRHSGMRPGEARMLRWAQLDHAILGEEGTYEIELSWTVTKGKRKSRPVFLTSDAMEALNALPRRADNPYVFGSPKRKGRPYSKPRLWRFFRDAADAAGLEAAPGDGSVRPHDSRRGAASELISADVALPKVQALLGHASITTTMGYVDVDRADLREAHSRLTGTTRKTPPKSE